MNRFSVINLILETPKHTFLSGIRVPSSRELSGWSNTFGVAPNMAELGAAEVIICILDYNTSLAKLYIPQRNTPTSIVSPVCCEADCHEPNRS